MYRQTYWRNINTQKKTTIQNLLVENTHNFIIQSLCIAMNQYEIMLIIGDLPFSTDIQSYFACNALNDLPLQEVNVIYLHLISNQ